MKSLLFAVGLLLSLASCRVQKKSQTIEIEKLLNNNLGYLLIDEETGDNLLQSNAQKYFIPASTTKLFTFYSSLNTLPETIPALKYKETADSLIFWGTGDPSLLHKEFDSSKTLDFLRSKANKHLVVSDSNFEENAYGKGWMWDDNLEPYQAEISPMPLYGNLVHFEENAVQPSFFASYIEKIVSTDLKVHRNETDNRFQLPVQREGLAQAIPYKTSGELTAKLLSDTLHLAVAYYKIDQPTFTQTLYSVQRDSLIIPMLFNSDNMFAEQLMLLCGHQSLGKLSISKAIDNLLSNGLAELPQKPRWVDGSGLSRYNLFTPQDLVFLLQKIKTEYGLAKLISYLPSNGNNGTMKTFAPNEPIFLHAKSGSMSGVYNMAGILETASGKSVIFAVMHNNFTKAVPEVRKETEEMLLRFRDKN